MEKQNLINLSKRLQPWLFDRTIWLGGGIVGLVVAYIEIGRRLSISVPIPFLILLGVVVLVAAFGGKRPGIVGAVVASFFIFYSVLIGFGPPTLTGGPVQAGLGIILMLAVGYFLGRTKDQNQTMIQALEEAHIELERRVARRTAELSTVNEQLNDEIAERIQAEEALRANEIYFRSLIENALDIVTVLNADGTIRYESPSVKQILGYEPEELIGRNVFDFIHPDDLERVQRNYSQWKKLGGRSRVLEFRFLHKDGSWRILEVIGNNLLGDPYVAGAVINSRDITRRREIEKKVQRQEHLALVGQLAAGIAHDFNNVMAVILLYAQLLELSPNLTEEEKRKLKIIYDEGQRAANLTTQILDFSRQSILDRQSIDLVPFLESFATLLGWTLPENIEIELDHEADSYVITVDSGRIQQALMNLALNSRDAMPDGGWIRLGIETIDYEPEEERPIAELGEVDWVRISVADSGSGFSPVAMAHLFEPFFTTKEPGEGTGLGLAQVYGIVKQHHGFVSVETEEGRGSTISLVLPMEKTVQLSVDGPIPDSVLTGSGELLLVVEDNDATRLALMSALESLNYRVKGAINGREAMAMLRRYREGVALVISDVIMPEMGGIALLEAMASENLSMPFILLTGNSPAEELELAKADGRIDWYMKPIPLEKLGRAVASRL